LSGEFYRGGGETNKGTGEGEKAERNIYILCAGCPKSDVAVILFIYLRFEVLTPVNMI
jgi:hypothetical protein